MKIQTVILAAGQGKRMQSDIPKVLHHLAGKPLLEHVIQTASVISSLKPIVVYGHHGEKVRQVSSHHPINWIEQAEQLGTGHALQQALSLIDDDHHVLILYGDIPLISADTLMQLIASTPKNAVGLLTAFLKNPFGYGRIKRDADQNVIQIIEEKEADEHERKIEEINTGIYFIPAAYLKKWLPRLQKNNKQQEYYLTDIIAFAVQEKILIQAMQTSEPHEILGVNDRLQLSHLERFYQQKLAEIFLRQGVTIKDPARLDIRGEVEIGRDVVLDVNVILEGRVIIGDGCIIGPQTILRDTTLGKQVEVKSHSVIEGATINAHCLIGPFARIRPGTVLASHVHVGNFVEIKNSAVNEKTKINHLSYVGDSDIGKEVNIGAGVITCNYDGILKHKTKIGDRVQVGSDSTLVAPVTLHDDVYVASATTVRRDVPAGSLVYNKREENIREGWTAKHREEKRK